LIFDLPGGKKIAFAGMHDLADPEVPG
jgi:hypothetical protein